jgi:hypothetical protein
MVELYTNHSLGFATRCPNYADVKQFSIPHSLPPFYITTAQIIGNLPTVKTYKKDDVLTVTV